MSTDPDRDAELAAVWREHSTETPPAHVDAAILAAAHREVASPPRERERWLGSRTWRWWVPLAAAAALAVIVVGVKPPGQTLVDDAAQTASDIPATRAEKQIATPAPAEKQRDLVAPAVPAPSAKADAIEPRQKLEERRAPAFATPPPSAVTKEAVTAQPGRDDAAAALSVEARINTIRALRGDGRVDEALRELARFRAAYPDADAHLPRDLREWANSMR